MQRLYHVHLIWKLVNTFGDLQPRPLALTYSTIRNHVLPPPPPYNWIRNLDFVARQGHHGALPSRSAALLRFNPTFLAAPTATCLERHRWNHCRPGRVPLPRHARIPALGTCLKRISRLVVHAVPLRSAQGPEMKNRCPVERAGCSPRDS